MVNRDSTHKNLGSLFFDFASKNMYLIAAGIYRMVFDGRPSALIISSASVFFSFSIYFCRPLFNLFNVAFVTEFSFFVLTFV